MPENSPTRRRLCSLHALMVRVPVTFMQPQLSDRLPGDSVFREPKAGGWSGSGFTVWARPGPSGLSWPSSEPPGTPRGGTQTAWSTLCLLLLMRPSSDGGRASCSPQPRPATWRAHPTRVSPCVSPQPEQMVWPGRPEAHSPQHHPGAGQATVPVVKLLDDGHRQLHKVPCMETQRGHRPLS